MSVASRANKPIGDKMIMNAAFLVAREKEAAFDAKVKQHRRAGTSTLTFKYTGPWPPYNFVNIRLKLERARRRRTSSRWLLIVDTLHHRRRPVRPRQGRRGGGRGDQRRHRLREELLAAQMRLELGEISEEEFAEIEERRCWRASARSASGARDAGAAGAMRIAGVDVSVRDGDEHDEPADADAGAASGRRALRTPAAGGARRAAALPLLRAARAASERRRARPRPRWRWPRPGAACSSSPPIPRIPWATRSDGRWAARRGRCAARRGELRARRARRGPRAGALARASGGERSRTIAERGTYLDDEDVERLLPAVASRAWTS